jgi:hypothetical protein
MTSPHQVADPRLPRGAYVLEGSSQIVGGPFNGFTGIWHLAGTFETV